MKKAALYALVAVYAVLLQLSWMHSVQARSAVRVIQTAQGTTDRMTEKPSLAWKPYSASAGTSSITIHRDQKFQTIIGYGGAFTEATAVNFAQLSPADQRTFLTMLFDKDAGIGYTLGRVHMNSCDFSVETYSFDDFVNDTSLLKFDIFVSHDKKAMIPLMRAAMKVASNPIKFFLSPWSPPAWMKVPVNGKQSMTGSATPNGLLPEMQATWALYYSKFIAAYAAAGVNFWGLTIQNESEFAAPWEACVYTPEFQRDFIKNYLGPQMRKDWPEIKIMAYDHNRDHVAHWASVMYSDPVARDFISGLAFHWYVSAAYPNLKTAHEYGPEKFLLNTEGCACPPIFNSWDYAEQYGSDYINDLNWWAQGFVDWNMLLDSYGGPNHLNNNCSAGFFRDAKTNALLVQPTYYYIGHISKYVLPDSVRIGFDTAITFDASVATQSGPHSSDGDNVLLWHCDGSPRSRWSIDMKLMNSNECMDVQDKSTADGANVQIWACSGGSNQQWTYHADSGFVTVGLDNKCLAVDSTVAGPGQNIVVKSCYVGDKSMMWSYDQATGMLHSQMDVSYCAIATGPIFTQTAVQQPNGDVAVVLQNMLDKVPVSLKLVDGNEAVDVTVPPHAIQTLIYTP